MSKKVLIIDDNYGFADLYKESLELKDFEVIKAIDGKSGLEIAQKEYPDCIILDLMLPRMSGQEVLRTLKSDDKTKDIPVIVTTAFTQRNEEMAQIEKTADRFLMKTDVNPKVMLEAVSGVVGIG